MDDSEYADHLGGRPAGADHRLRARVRADRPRLGAADPPHRGRPVRPRAHRRGAGPDPDAVADGRPPWPRRVVDDRRRPGAVLVAGRRGVRRRPAPRRSRASSVHEFHLSTNYRNSSEIYEYAAAYAERVGLDADLPTAVRSTGVEPTVAHGRGRPGAGRPGRGRRARRRGGRHRRDRRTRRPAGRGQLLAGVVAGARRGRPVRGRVGRRRRPSGEDRVVVLTGLDTKGLEFDGIVVVASAGDRGRVGDRPRDALRRAHARDPAAQHGLLRPEVPSRRPGWH